MFAARVTAAHAQDASPEVLAKVTKLNKKALDAYAKRDYEAARTALKEALDICGNQGLDSHPIKARTHIHLGAVLIGGFKQREAGIKHFRKALQIQPDIQLTKSIATPALQDAFEEAMVASAPAGGGGDDPERNQPAQSSGDDQNPPGGADGDDSPRRRTAVKPKKKKKRHGDDDDDGGDDKKGDDDDDDDVHVAGANAGKIFVGLTGGSGMGWASGTGEMSSTIKHDLAQGGFALAQAAHVSPEVGYFFSSSLLLSVQLRYQIITGLNPGPNTCGTTACSPSSSAIAVLARATMFLGDGDLHFFVGGAVGGGTIRHVSNFPADSSCAPNPGMTSCVDTLAAGPFLVGPSAGLFYDMGKTASLILAVNTEVGVPKFTFNVDVNAGVGLRF